MREIGWMKRNMGILVSPMRRMAVASLDRYIMACVRLSHGYVIPGRFWGGHGVDVVSVENIMR